MRSTRYTTLLLLLLPLFACGDRVVGFPLPDTAAPMVSATTPVAGELEVALNRSIAVTFSEPMDPASIHGGTVTVMRGSTPVDGTVRYAGVTALFTPDHALDHNTEYTATVSAAVTDLAGNAMGADYVWSFTTGAFPDVTAPMVSATIPASGATLVVTNTPILVTFSEAMDPTTITAANITVRQGNTPVAGTVAYTGVTAVFTPAQALAQDTAYTVTVSAAVTDLAGNGMAADHVWTFTTGALVDVTAPTVSSTIPASNATNVVINTPIAITFSEAMDPLTITTATITVRQGTNPVAGTVTYAGVTAIFTPTQVPASGTVYTVTVSDSVTDLAGNAMAADYVWTFTTGGLADVTAPTVSSTIPASNATGVTINTPIAVTFSEAMSPATINTVSLTLRKDGDLVAGTVTYAGVTAVFTPDQVLAHNSTYTATVSTAVTDLAGNAMAANYVWTFTTGALVDTIAPTVSSTVPASDATGVATNTPIAITFSEAMNPLTITTANITLAQGANPIAGTVTYAGVTAIFTPTQGLAHDTGYTATVSAAVTDLAGNAMAAAHVWSFTTGTLVDVTAPTVSATAPMDDATEVPLDTLVVITFSEAIDPMTITATSVMVEDADGVEVPGMFTAVGNTAVFTPANDLAPMTEYTVTVTTAVTDLAGNPMVEDHHFVFTTGEDLVPRVLFTLPEDLATGVQVNTAINATFNVDMDPLTLNDSTFFVMGPGGVAVPGSLFYDELTATIRLSPDEDLLPSTTYIARVTHDATDLAGVGLAQDHIWTFTTGEELEPGVLPVNLRSLSTFVAVAGAGLTNSNSGGTTTLGGDVGLYPDATCMGDGSICSLTNPVITGTLYAADPEGIAAQAKIDLTAAYVDATSRPVGTTVNDITGMTLAPGVYTSDSTMSVAVGGTVTLDGEGDDDAVFIFQIGSSLTVNNSAQVLLTNGAQAKNVFWAVFASSTLGTDVSFVGNILAGASNSVETGSVVLGRLLCRTGQITLLSNTITLPPN